MRETKGYITSDGTFFEDKRRANLHEKEVYDIKLKESFPNLYIQSSEMNFAAGYYNVKNWLLSNKEYMDLFYEIHKKGAKQL